MIEYINRKTGIVIAELKERNYTVATLQDAVDLLGDIGFNGCSRLIIHEENLHKDFFDLKTRLAGDILQKFSNYRIKVAIVGKFGKFHSKSLQAFIRESNRGSSVFFVEDVESAVNKLTIS